MSDSDGGPEEESQTELRQRIRSEENEKDCTYEKEIEAVLIDNESGEIISEATEVTEPTEISDVLDEPKVTVCRGIRNLQPLQRPSFLSRQFNNIKSFFAEFIEFILLFLTTLFNPMADVNTQVQEHNQRRMAREGRYFSSSNKPKKTSFPGCGPSS